MIPEIDVRGSIARKIWEGELDFSFEADASLLDIPFVSFASPVRVQLCWSILGDNSSVEVHASLAFTLAGACSRCLSEASQEAFYETDALFVAGEGDGETYGYRNGRIALDEFLRDGILFALPSRLLCRACTQWENE